MGISKQEIEKLKNERLGKVAITDEGYMIKIIEYNGTRDIVVEFQDEYKAKIRGQYTQFEKGNFRNPYHKSIYGVGYLGVGKYKFYEGKNGTDAYILWRNILKRCYDAYCINKYPTYKDCFVCEEWHNYQNFAKWYEENYYEVKDEIMCLDKDILIKGNKIYSPNTCVFVPNRINVLFTKRQNHRGEYPIGISYYIQTNKLRVNCCVIDEKGKHIQKHLGYFPLNKPFQAFYTYKTFKENYIKQVADEYKNSIPIELYNALYSWEVEIND